MRSAVVDAGAPGVIDRAAELLRGGGLVAFPTETVYGLGADALNVRAVARIFAAKRRPFFDPLIVHLASASDLSRVARPRDSSWELLAREFWPGPLTLILTKTDAIPDLVTAGLPTVAVRVPRHDAALAILSAAGRPIAAPSANPFGYVSPTTAQHVAEGLGDEVDLIVDGGTCSVGVESTILSLQGPAPLVLRPGGVPVEAIEEVLGQEVSVADRRMGDGEAAEAPGLIEGHYAPRTKLILCLAGAPIAPVPGRRTGLLAYREARDGFAAVEVLSPSGDMGEAAARLFAALRHLDGLGLDVVVAEAVPETGLGRAIMDRLRRASATRRDGLDARRP